MRFRNGNIVVPGPIYRPTSFTVQHFAKPGSTEIVREEKRKFSHVGGGWHFQADEVARCIRDGKKESALWGLDKSLLEMEVFDEVRISCVAATSISWSSNLTAFIGQEAERLCLPEGSRAGSMRRCQLN